MLNIILFILLTFLPAITLGISTPETPDAAKIMGSLKKPKRVREEIIGSDNRQKVVSSLMPWSAIGKVKSFDEDGTYIGACSGSLISAWHVLTNRHCVVDEDGDDYDVVKFYPNYKDGNYTFSSTWSHVWYGDTEEEDWAIIQLRSPLGDLFGWFGVANPTAKELTSAAWKKKIILAGYPGDKEDGESPYAHIGCSITGIEDGAIAHTCDTKPGASGSPLFIQTGDDDVPYTIVGLHNSGPAEGENTNFGVLSKHYYPQLQKVRSKPQKFWDAEKIYYHLCNWAHGPSIDVAVANNQTDGSWNSRGWYSVNLGNCIELAAPAISNGLASHHYFAKTDSVKYGDKSAYCVNPNKAFHFGNADGDCPAGGVKEKFAHWILDQKNLNRAFFNNGLNPEDDE